MSDEHVEAIMNLEEASRYLRIKRRTLYALAARGSVPAAKIGGQWRFRKAQLDRLFESAEAGGALRAPQTVVP
jgi:excisionase family DNA binding protein